ncbi:MULTISPECIES: chorismate mutase [Streptacidiphilus]|uniref:Chorismate mutase n=1 Tax=Streptacidiphilus cavernicola TaxID=3342716 RepID=A0ABV6USI5_9ACTN|nr:chorismate mutase [Streptacidiphilus jeojiense]
MDISTSTTAGSTAPGTTGTTGTPGLTVEQATTVIAEARGRIDELDERIIELIRQRTGVSAEVQTARIATGGPRLALNRELEILARYRAALGPQGTEVAMQLLELCRGRA